MEVQVEGRVGVKPGDRLESLGVELSKENRKGCRQVSEGHAGPGEESASHSQCVGKPLEELKQRSGLM